MLDAWIDRHRTWLQAMHRLGCIAIVLRMMSTGGYRCRVQRHRMPVHLRTMLFSACAVAKCDKTWRVRTGTL
ncbi:hypothetical protein XarjCFBP7645_07720 [Xanthomonas arboricola]|uniref:Uncharacterized protein n=1 Tax=Xanthomonas arboricola TaxID=56448 RepID=A0A2S7ACR4_9XANT|nr:hypothetical protein XarjCFBP7645_07720 [Xanthomonas arboricola]